MSLHKAKTQIDHAFTRSDLKGLSFENAFAGANSFMRRRYTKDLTGVELAVTGVPFDQAEPHTFRMFGSDLSLLLQYCSAICLKHALSIVPPDSTYSRVDGSEAAANLL